MDDAAQFISWLLEDVNDVHAEIGTPRDETLKEFATKGFLKLSLSCHGENTYEITSKGYTAWVLRAVER